MQGAEFIEKRLDTGAENDNSRHVAVTKTVTRGEGFAEKLAALLKPGAVVWVHPNRIKTVRGAEI